jgi:hypothetical protein
MVDEMFAWMLEESHLRGKRMSKDRRHSGARVETECFRCTHCGAYVVREPLFSGVVNRNHCPYCLWSRHVDWQRAGDRMSACKGQMRPVGLALKHQRNKYAIESGELMLIHACKDCGQVSVNRIAADDCAEALLAVFTDINLLNEQVCTSLRDAGITWLTQEKMDLVCCRLYGAKEAARTAPAGAVP